MKQKEYFTLYILLLIAMSAPAPAAIAPAPSTLTTLVTEGAAHSKKLSSNGRAGQCCKWKKKKKKQ